MRCLPNIIVMTPSNAAETRAMLEFGYQYQGPAAVRYPRGAAPNNAVLSSPIVLGRGQLLCSGKDHNSVVILNFGALLELATEVATQLSASLVDMRFVKPLDKELLQQLLTQHSSIVTIEDHSIIGGAGSAVGEWLAQQSTPTKLLCLGHEDRPLTHGSRAQVLAATALGVPSAVARINTWLSNDC